MFVARVAFGPKSLATILLHIPLHPHLLFFRNLPIFANTFQLQKSQPVLQSLHSLPLTFAHRSISHRGEVPSDHLLTDEPSLHVLSVFVDIIFVIAMISAWRKAASIVIV